MVDGGLLTKIDRLGHTICSNELPFGGIQIVCSGDFCRGFRAPINRTPGGSPPCHLATWQPAWPSPFIPDPFPCSCRPADAVVRGQHAKVGFFL